MKKIVNGAGVCLFLLLCVTFLSDAVIAQSLISPNFRFDESTLGGGGQIQSSSANYQSSSSIGDLAVGESASTNFQVQSGSKTTNDPALSFVMNSTNANFSDFTPTASAVATASFSVSNYTSYGYVVQIAGNAPANGGYTLPAMPLIDDPLIGNEQFGINLVANTIPTSVGANPSYGPFAVGSPTANYGVANKYRYVSGDTIASAPKSSGSTTYTLSYMVNVKSVTPGGQYTSNQTLIVTGTY